MAPSQTVSPLSVRRIRTYRVAMASGMYVRVPRGLADSLEEDGFRMAGTERGIEVYANATEMVLGASADLVTVFVGRHEISRFIAHIWALAHRRKPIQQHDMTVLVERDGRRVR
jgi:hypothetical protein